MNCWNCHLSVPEIARFCPHCGASLTGPEQAQANETAQVPPTPPGFGQDGPAYGAGQAYGIPNGGGTATACQTKKPLPKKLLLILAAAAVAAAAVVILVIVLLTGKPTVRLNKYLTFEEKGYDGYGYLCVTFDYDSFEDDYYGKLKFDKHNSDVKSYLDYSRWWDDDYDEKADALALFEENCISFFKEDSWYCSNGDTVPVYWEEPDETDLSYFRCKVKYSTVEYTMSELKTPEEVDLFGGIGVTFSGIDTIGKASLTIRSQSGLYDGLEFTLEPSTGLSNGDTVTVTASAVGMELEEYCVNNYGLTPVSDTMVYQVSGLEDAQKVDPFSYVTLKYTGIAPLGTLSLVVDTGEEMIRNLVFTLDKTADLTVGDVVTITVSAPGYQDTAAYCLNHYGVELTSLSKEVTLSGFPYYITQLSQVPDAMLEQMQDRAMDDLDGQIAGSGESDLNLEQAEYLGSYLLVSQKWNRVDLNRYYLVYRVTVSHGDGEDSFYYCMRFQNLTVLADGTGSVDLDACVLPVAKVNIGGTNLSGYASLDTLFNDCVLLSGEYDCESSVSED